MSKTQNRIKQPKMLTVMGSKTLNPLIQFEVKRLKPLSNRNIRNQQLATGSCEFQTNIL